MVEILKMRTEATYKEFDEDILLVYRNIIKKYKLVLNSYDIDSYMLFNDDFILTFIYNRGEIRSFIKYNGFIHEKKEIDDVLKKLKIDEEVKDPENYWDPKQVLQWYNNMTVLVLDAIDRAIETRKRFGMW